MLENGRLFDAAGSYRGLLVEDADALHAEYAARGAMVTRPLGDTPWGTREFVVRDCDGRLLAFGSNQV